MARLFSSDPVVDERLSEFYQQILPYMGVVGTPVGTIISFMGLTAPDGYLACNGAEYQIANYSTLANFFEAQFGSKNFFGGNGTTTFAVPDLQGEFLRGTGTNSHSLGGDGLPVGYHQSATAIPNIGVNTVNSKTIWTNSDKVSVSGGVGISVLNPDKFIQGAEATTTGLSLENGSFSTTWSGATGMTNYTSRPTNTSVLYCIAYRDNVPNLGGPNYTELTGELVAGQTSITFNSSLISSNSSVDVYTDTFGVTPTNVLLASGSVTVSFTERGSNLGVKVRIS